MIFDLSQMISLESLDLLYLEGRCIIKGHENAGKLARLQMEYCGMKCTLDGNLECLTSLQTLVLREVTLAKTELCIGGLEQLEEVIIEALSAPGNFLWNCFVPTVRKLTLTKQKLGVYDSFPQQRIREYRNSFKERFVPISTGIESSAKNCSPRQAKDLEMMSYISYHVCRM